MDRCWGPRNGQAGLTRVNPRPPPTPRHRAEPDCRSGGWVQCHRLSSHPPPPPPPPADVVRDPLKERVPSPKLALLSGDDARPLAHLVGR